MTVDAGGAAASDPKLAIDNDILLKVICYRLEEEAWPDGGIGVLGAARYVLPRAISRLALAGNKEDITDRLDRLLNNEATELEPSEAEVALAADFEAVAQREGLELDSGESQLAAIVASRPIEVLQTGDKRAIAALERALTDVPSAEPLRASVQCLEQLFLKILGVDEKTHASVTACVCGEKTVDTTLTICFGCHSGGAARTAVIDGLNSYINALRNDAPELLVI